MVRRFRIHSTAALIIAEFWLVKGLGGTSLVNGNIYLEADRSTLAASAWPSEITGDPECLEKCEHKYICTSALTKERAQLNRDLRSHSIADDYLRLQ